MTDKPDNRQIERVVVTGFSGSGKSAIASRLAEGLGWTAVDLDADLAAEFEMPVPAIFSSLGEPKFREAERRHLLSALSRPNVVIATGGGACLADELWSDDLLRHPATITVALDAEPHTLLRRIQFQQEEEGYQVVRPLLDAADPLQRITSLKSARQEAYDRAEVTLIVDRLNEEEVAIEIGWLLRMLDGDLAGVPLRARSGASQIWIGPNASNELPDLLANAFPSSKKAWIISDSNVGPLFGEKIGKLLAFAGIAPQLGAVNPGEASKSIASASGLYDWMLNGGVERSDVVIALGGGVVGDLAGFVAATVLRGIGLVQIPTSLLAMVDSSVGGKTGINHPAGKNLIGSFYQPPLVIADTSFLQTLPSFELRQGWAEILKHAVIQVSTPGGNRGDLLRFIERNRRQLQSLQEPALTYLIQRNVALKAAVVEADEREEGVRSLLNFGHTFGHAIEAHGYQTHHGDAVALGMRAAMRLGVLSGSIEKESVDQLDSILDDFEFPRTVDADPAEIMALTNTDKKRKDGRVRFVLPLNGGGVELRDDIEPSLAMAAFSQLCS